MNDDTLVYYGDDVKALGSGRVGGRLIRFGSPRDHDVQGDYFDEGTYLGVKAKHGIDIYYHHGFLVKSDPLSHDLRATPIGEGEVKCAVNGVDIEAQLDITKPAIGRVYDSVGRGEQGWSSGSTDRMVVREPIKAGVARIARWPIVEGSLSKRVVDSRNKAHAIKAIIDGDVKGMLGDGASYSIMAGALDRLNDLLRMRIGESINKPNASKDERIKQARECLDEYTAKLIKLLKAITDDGDVKAIVEQITDGVASTPIVDRVEALTFSAETLCGDLESIKARHELNAAKREAIKAVSERFAKLHDAIAPRQESAPDRRASLVRRLRLLRAESNGKGQTSRLKCG